MSFKVNDLAVSLPGTNGDGDPCPTLTMTGCGVNSLVWGAAAQRQLAVLKAQLRNAMSRT
jgi:hypothetical protein